MSKKKKKACLLPGQPCRLPCARAALRRACGCEVCDRSRNGEEQPRRHTAAARCKPCARGPWPAAARFAPAAQPPQTPRTRAETRLAAQPLFLPAGLTESIAPLPPATTTPPHHGIDSRAGRPPASTAQNPSHRPHPSPATTINPVLPASYMLAVPFSCLRIARNPIRVRLLHPVSAARVTRLAMSTTPPPAAATISVEYAKSGRSTCKGCSGAIASGALRLGASARDPRGFDATKWYHVSCLPSSSHPLGPIESIKGFDSIKVRSMGG